MNTKPKISIIIPVFNGSDYLEEAIKSCLKQTYKEYEIIVINDGSNDGGKTKLVAQKYKRYIRYYEKENGGVSSALNFGIRQMEGEFFTWLSHDDVFCPNKLEEQMAAIELTGKKSTIALANYYLANAELNMKQNTNFQKYFSYDMLTNSVFLLLWGEFHFSGLLFHKSHFERIGLFDEMLKAAQDNDFIFRLLNNQELVFTMNPVSVVRLHEDSGTVRNKSVVNEENRNVYYRWILSTKEQDMIKLTGNKYSVWTKVAGILLSMGDLRLPQMILQSIPKGALRVPNGKDFEYLFDKEIIIFGSGQYGIRLKYELEAHGIYPYCFIDNAIEKHGKSIEGMSCFLPNAVKDLNSYEIIIAQKYHVQAAMQLEKMSIRNYLLKEDVDSMLLRGDCNNEVEK